MRLKMLIATEDKNYSEPVSDYISEQYGNTVNVSVCSASEHLGKMLAGKRYDVALVEPVFFERMNCEEVQLAVLLVDDVLADFSEGTPVVAKYQRISSIVSDIFERYSMLSGRKHDAGLKTGKVTTIWSPAGGVGKTTVSLAHASSMADDGKKVFYLNLEAFSSMSTYFEETGKSISNVFEMLGNTESDVKMFIQGICKQENGITYLNGPNNYADMQVLSVENISELISVCAVLTDELIVDLPCQCDSRTQQVLESADNVLIVTDSTKSSETKLIQFMKQNIIFETICDKVALVENKGASVSDAIIAQFDAIPARLQLPFVSHDDESAVYKELSTYVGGNG